MLEFFVKLVSCWKLPANATKSSILAFAMVLDKSLCFFQKTFYITCFIIYFNMCSQVRTLSKNVTFQGRGMIKIWAFVNVGPENLCHWVRNIKKGYGHFPFSHDIILMQNYVIIFILSSLVNICQNYIGLC